jgi:hypothetical protein
MSVLLIKTDYIVRFNLRNAGNLPACLIKGMGISKFYAPEIPRHAKVYLPPAAPKATRDVNSN